MKRAYRYLSAAVCLAVLFAPAVYGTSYFEVSNTLTINDGFDPPTTASRYPWQVTVSGLTGVISALEVRLGDYDHSWPADVDVLLVGPTGLSMILMSDAGGSGSASSVYLTFSDGAAGLLPQYSNPVTGTYRPTNYDEFDGDIFPAPAPAGPYGSTLSTFNGTDPNGVWSLYVTDDSAGDNGSIWKFRVGIDTADAVPEPASLALVVAGFALAVFRRRLASR